MPESTDKPKSIELILGELLQSGLKEYDRTSFSLFVSAITAGMEVGFSVLLMGVVYTLFSKNATPESVHMMVALSYPIGFLFVVIGRSELFTEHTNMSFLPVLEGQKKIPALLRVWGLILLGNLLGGLVIAAMLLWVGSAMEIISDDAFIHLAKKMTKHSSGTILGSAILAGWMMGLLSWLIAASRETISRMLVVIIVTAVIGIAGLHHSIVGSIEIILGMFSAPSEIPLSEYVRVESVAILGNVIGGALFVAVFKYIHTRRAHD